MLRSENLNNYIASIAQLISGSIYLSSRIETVEERLLKSEIIKDLEDNDESFLNVPLETIFMNTFNIEPPLKVFGLFNSCFYWVSEAYLRLFFRYKKSFSYLFLLLPLKKCIELFELYHQMDFKEMYKLFERLMNENKILPLLIKKNVLTMKTLSKLSNINYYSIDSYCRNDNKLFNASYKNLLSLSKTLNVNINIFLEKLDIKNLELYY